MISGKRIVITHVLPCQSWKHVLFTCVSISTTCRPKLDTFWLIKCKMAWKEKIKRESTSWPQFTASGNHWFLYHINKREKTAKRALNPWQNSSFSTSQMISSPCYTCFTVLTLWASSFSSWSMGSSSEETEQPGKVTSGCAGVLLRVKGSNEGDFFTHSERCRERRSRRACSKSQSQTWASAHLPTRHTTTFCSPIFCENFHLRAGFDASPADLQTGENGIDITSGFRATGRGE